MNDLDVLSPEQQELLLRIAERRRVEPDTVIVRQGDPASAMYLIESGAVDVEVDHLGSPVTVNELGPGEVFGEISFVDGGRVSATCVAATSVAVAVFDQATLDELLATDPALAAATYRAFAIVLAGRLRRRDGGFAVAPLSPS